MKPVCENQGVPESGTHKEAKMEFLWNEEQRKRLESCIEAELKRLAPKTYVKVTIRPERVFLARADLRGITASLRWQDVIFEGDAVRSGWSIWLLETVYGMPMFYVGSITDAVELFAQCGAHPYETKPSEEREAIRNRLMDAAKALGIVPNDPAYKHYPQELADLYEESEENRQKHYRLREWLDQNCAAELEARREIWGAQNELKKARRRGQVV